MRRCGVFVSAVYHQPTRPLFGMETKATTRGDVVAEFAYCREAEIEQEKIVLTRCRTQQASVPCSGASVAGHRAAEGADRSGRARVGWINRAVNLRYHPDQATRHNGALLIAESPPRIRDAANPPRRL